MKFGIHQDKNKLRRFYIGRVNVRFERWPWMVRTHKAWLSGPDENVGDRYGWLPTKGMGRFGGGWNWSLGFEASSTTVILNLLFGYIRISWYQEKTDDQAGS